MSTISAKRKPVARAITLPPKGALVERVGALIQAVFAASPAERCAALEAWEQAIDEYLDRIAEETRPPSIPGPWLRLQLDARGYGDNPTRALIRASKTDA
jgi:hypothetical protein